LRRGGCRNVRIFVLRRQYQPIGPHPAIAPGFQQAAANGAFGPVRATLCRSRFGNFIDRSTGSAGKVRYFHRIIHFSFRPIVISQCVASKDASVSGRAFSIASRIFASSGCRADARKKFLPSRTAEALSARVSQRCCLTHAAAGRRGVIQPAVFAQATRSKSIMKSRVIGTASRLVDRSN
jgi:hypothetical protein